MRKRQPNKTSQQSAVGTIGGFFALFFVAERKQFRYKENAKLLQNKTALADIEMQANYKQKF